MTTEELAELLGVTDRTIKRWRVSGDGPPHLLFGRTVRYHPARVQAWMLAREQGTPSRKRGTPAREGGTPARGGTRGR
jgi:excisionase family DNA binding protein